MSTTFEINSSFLELGLPNRLKFKIYSMKKCIYIALLCLTSWTVFAQEAEQIDLGSYGTLLVRTNKKPIEYFETQMKLWEKKVKQNNKDANAWLNYFAVTKYLNHIDLTKKWKELQSKPGSKIGKGVDMSKSEYQHETIAQEAYKNLPNSFEANYMMHFKDNFMIKRDYSYLLKAHEIKPYDTKILDALIRYYHLVNDTVNLKKTAIEIANSNLISTNEYNLAYNLLAELDDQAVLLVTYHELVECIVLQQTKNIKPKVIITTKDIIAPANQDEFKYSDIVLARMGISRRIQEIVTSGSMKAIDNNFKESQRNYVQDVFNVNQPVYVSLNSINMFKDDFSNQLYLHGLTYRYSKQPANYIYNIKDNYEKNYSLDYIKHDILPNPIDNYDQSLYYMYYPSALKLYEFYKEKGLFLQQQEMKKFIQLIAEKSGKDFIKNSDLFKENEVVTYSRAEIDFKKLEASFVALNAVEHIGKFEVTNGEYNLFLKNLKQSKNYELYYKCMIDSTRWSSVFPTAYHDPMIDFYHHHPAYDNYPVVNISYEGAVAYCKWLTVQYNQQHPEEKYVSFRLPTEQEWRYAAGSKNEKAITSFPNDNILTSNPNIKELKALGKFTKDGVSIPICYLGNIKTDSGYQADGGFHTTNVTSYPPNALGIYNTFGNVAEMTSTKGVIKGGSWADLFSECTFDKNATYSATDPRVGFRIMMEVVPDIKHLSAVKINKNLFCLIYEDNISDYWSYLKNLIQLYGINSNEYKIAFPDSTLWKNENIQALKNILNYAQLDDSLRIIRTIEKTFVPLDTLTKVQLDNFLKYRSDQEFKNYLIENEYIINLHMQNNPPIFTKEAYYDGKLDSICLKEKFMYYPELSLPTDYEKQMANAYTNKQIEKQEYTPTNPNSINSRYVNKTYFDLVKHKSKSYPGFYSMHELKPGIKLSDIKPFDLWENYRFVLTWKPWNPNQTK